MSRNYTLAAFALTAVLLAGCGGQSASEREAATEAKEAEKSAQAEAEREEQAEAEAAAKRKEQQANYDNCKSVTEPLRSALAEMNSRLTVGLNYDEYTNRLGDVQVAYDKVVPQIDPDLGQGCINSAIKLENALNEYNKVSNAWGECMEDIYCDFEGERLENAQAGWARAGTATTRSSNVLERIAP